MPKLFVVLIFLGFVAVAVPHLESLSEAPYAARTEVEEPAGYGARSVSLEADRRGHFILDAVVNGRTITMLADTGASAVVLTESDARRAGFEPRSLDFDVPVKTANGESRAAAIRLDSVDVGGIRLDRVEGVDRQIERRRQLKHVRTLTRPCRRAPARAAGSLSGSEA